MRFQLCSLLALMLMVGCGDDNKDETGNDDTGEAKDPFSQFIDVTEEAVGDFSCFTPGGDWISQSLDAAQALQFPATGFIEDFEDKIGVGDADLEVWFNDTSSGTPDQTGTSDDDGMLALELMSCTPTTYRVTTNAELDQTKDTYEAHSVYDVPTGGVIDTSFNSVSTTTYTLIPGLLGISLDEDKGVVAGTAFDCNEQPAQNLQVVVVDADGAIPESLVVNYFKQEWPVKDQPWTSEDGLWVASNVPAGDWSIQLWGLVDGEIVQLGATALIAFADSVNISNIYLGFGDGVKYPPGCLAVR